MASTELNTLNIIHTPLSYSLLLALPFFSVFPAQRSSHPGPCCAFDHYNPSRGEEGHSHRRETQRAERELEPRSLPQFGGEGTGDSDKDRRDTPDSGTVRRPPPPPSVAVLMDPVSSLGLCLKTESLVSRVYQSHHSRQQRQRRDMHTGCNLKVLCRRREEPVARRDRVAVFDAGDYSRVVWSRALITTLLTTYCGVSRGQNLTTLSKSVLRSRS